MSRFESLPMIGVFFEPAHVYDSFAGLNAIVDELCRQVLSNAVLNFKKFNSAANVLKAHHLNDHLLSRSVYVWLWCYRSSNRYNMTEFRRAQSERIRC